MPPEKPNEQKNRRLPNTRDAGTFLIFLAVAAAFWLLMSLNDEVQRSYDIDLIVTDLPDNITVLNEIPEKVSVTVRDHGRVLLPYEMGKKPKLVLRGSDFEISGNNKMLISRQKLFSRINDFFGQSTAVSAIEPDSISFRFTSLHGHKVSVKPDITASAVPEAEIYGTIRLTPDTVDLYRKDGMHVASSLKTVFTEKLILKDLADSTVVTLRVETPEGIVAKPATVQAVIPVQKLISKRARVAIKPVGSEEGEEVTFYPEEIEISYLLPLNLMDCEPDSAPAVANIRNIISENRASVELTHVPDYWRSVEYTPKEVEFSIQSAAETSK